MKQIPRIPKLTALPKPTLPLGQAALAFLLSAARLGGAHVPFGLGMISAAGAKLPGLFCLLGAAVGAWAFLDFQTALRYLASGILIFSVNTAFYDTKIYTRPFFRSLASVAATAVVQFLYLLERGAASLVVFALSLAVQALAADLFQSFFTRQPDPVRRRKGWLLLSGALCLALVPVQTVTGFSLGRALLSLPLLLSVSLYTPTQSAVVGFCAGLAAELVGAQPTALYGVLCGCGCAAACLLKPYRLPGALAYCLFAPLTAVLLGADGVLTCLWEAQGGAVLFLLLPRKLVPADAAEPSRHPAAPRRTPETSTPLKGQLEQSAAAFRDLYDCFFRGTSPAPPENPSVIFDHAAAQVCRSCVLCSSCWQQNYNTTYNAFNDACPHLLRRGQAQAQDFPLYFTSRCVHLQDFLSAVNTELRAFLLRRQYHQRLSQTRQMAQEQYAQLGDLLSGAAAAAEAMSTAHPLGYRIGSALRPREGGSVCGDQLAVFEVGSTVYLLLSDGMGSGENAHREAAMTVRLLQQFLKAGIDPAPALKTLNAALALRGESGGGFTTIDLLALNRSSGSGELYKYGAAPSYLKRSGSVSRFTASSLPAGLQTDSQTPAYTRLSLPGSSFFVMISDGIADENDDEWLQNLLAGWSGNDPSALTSLILSESRTRRGLQDDCAVLVLYLPGPEKGGRTQV